MYIPSGGGQPLPDGGKRPTSNTNASFRGVSLIRNRTPLGPYSKTTPRALGGS